SCAASVCADRAGDGNRMRWSCGPRDPCAACSSVSSTRRPVWVLIVLLVAIAVGVVWYPRRGPSGAASRDVAAETRATPPPAAATGVGHAIEAAASQDAATQRSTARAKRDALREQ